jgi:hypothetical protein
MTTTDGPTRLTTSTYACWSAAAIPPPVSEPLDAAGPPPPEAPGASDSPPPLEPPAEPDPPGPPLSSMDAEGPDAEEPDPEDPAPETVDGTGVGLDELPHAATTARHAAATAERRGRRVITGS